MVSSESLCIQTEVLYQFSHINLVTFIGVCTKEEPFYIVTEFLDNGNLLEYFRGGKGKSLNINNCVDIGAQVNIDK